MIFLIWSSVTIFVVGNVFRIVRIAAMPVHLRWDLYPIPANRSGKLKVMAEEVLFLRGVWEHNRSLWVWSWMLHWACYVGICCTVLTLIQSLSSTAMTGAVSLFAWVSAVFGVCGTVGLAACRLARPALRMLTSRAAFLNLGILFLVFATGLNMLAQGEGAREMVEIAGSALTLEPAPHLSLATTLHVCMSALLLAYFPFTHMTHMYLKYFTFHSVRWDDMPLKNAPAMEGKLSRALDLPAHWSAPHIGASGAKTWREIAVEGTADAAEKTNN